MIRKKQSNKEFYCLPTQPISTSPITITDCIHYIPKPSRGARLWLVPSAIGCLLIIYSNQCFFLYSAVLAHLLTP